MNTITSSQGNINYNFIAVPTQLFILLDYRLKLVLTSLIQVSTALANSDGWFFYSKEDLKKLCGLKSDKTIVASIETLYRLNILKVQSRTFTNNIGKRTANYYKLNLEEIAKYNEYSVYECLNIAELRIPMLNYTSKDYKTTYTATTVEDSNDEEKQLTIVQDKTDERLPNNEVEKPLEAQEIALNETVETNTPIQLENDLREIANSDNLDQCVEPINPLDSILWDEASTPTKTIIETACVKPSEDKIERRSIVRATSSQIDDVTVGKCYDLVKRYQELPPLNNNEVEEKFRAAWDYIYKKYNKGLILESDRSRLQSCLIAEKFKRLKL